MTKQTDELIEQVASDIFAELAFTNGNHIDDSDYEDLCDGLAKDIISLIRNHDKQGRDAVLDEAIEAVNKQYTMYQKEDWTGTPRYSSGIIKSIEELK